MDFTKFILFAIEFFLFIITSALFYLVFDYFKFKFTCRKKEKILNTFGEKVLDDLNSIKRGEKFSYDDIIYARKNIEKKIFFDVFNEVIIKFNSEDLKNFNYTRQYLVNFNFFIDEKVIKSKNDDIKKTYLVYLLGEYGLNDQVIRGFLIKNLNTKSSHLRSNVISAIGKIGDVNLLITALISISNLKVYNTVRAFNDVFVNFRGDKRELSKELFDNLDKLNDKIKIATVEYFKTFKVEFPKMDLLKRLKENDENRYVKFAILNYFSVVKCKEGVDVFLDLLNSEYYEYRALSAKALVNYKSQVIKEGLLKSITDPNWDVRLRSASSLLDNYEIDEIRREVLKKEDRFAKDILFYAMYLKNKITYDEYLMIGEEVK